MNVYVGKSHHCEFAHSYDTSWEQDILLKAKTRLNSVHENTSDVIIHELQDRPILSWGLVVISSQELVSKL